MIKLAKFYSFFLHPLFMPLITLLVVLEMDSTIYLDPSLRNFIFLILLINTLAPGISIWVMYKRGIVSDLEVEKRSERFVPFLLVIFYYLMSYLILRLSDIGLQVEILSLFSALITTLVFCLIISFFYKISMHTMAHGALLGVVVALAHLHEINALFAICLIILSGASMAWARILLRLHTPAQTLLGWGAGALVHYCFLMNNWYF